jgi:hypothetical protein
MAARRAVRDACSGARERVQDAKVALGERGEPWWDEPSEDGQRERLAAAIRALAMHRAPDRTICPSDAARTVGGKHWRRLSPLARDVARELAGSGDVEVLQKGVVLDPDAHWRGPIRIRRPG